MRVFFLDAQGARFVFLQLLKVVSLPFLSNLKNGGGNYRPGQTVGEKLTKFHWGCGCLVVFKRLNEGLSEVPSIL